MKSAHFVYRRTKKGDDVRLCFVEGSRLALSLVDGVMKAADRVFYVNGMTRNRSGFFIVYSTGRTSIIVENVK
jgi:hypothetical protein